jgi:uncharacterized membrane protein (DUF485 family)
MEDNINQAIGEKQTLVAGNNNKVVADDSESSQKLEVTDNSAKIEKLSSEIDKISKRLEDDIDKTINELKDEITDLKKKQTKKDCRLKFWIKQTNGNWFIVGIIILLIGFDIFIHIPIVDIQSSYFGAIMGFVGILATFIVVGNYAQVKDIKDEFKTKVDEFKTKMKESEIKIEEIEKESNKVINEKIKDYSHTVTGSMYIIMGKQEYDNCRIYSELQRQLEAYKEKRMQEAIDQNDNRIKASEQEGNTSKERLWEIEQLYAIEQAQAQELHQRALDMGYLMERAFRMSFFYYVDALNSFDNVKSGIPENVQGAILGFENLRNTNEQLNTSEGYKQTAIRLLQKFNADPDLVNFVRQIETFEARNERRKNLIKSLT